MSVVEVEGSQARTLLGKCIHMREGAGVERLDVMRLDSGTLAGGRATQRRRCYDAYERVGVLRSCGVVHCDLSSFKAV